MWRRIVCGFILVVVCAGCVRAHRRSAVEIERVPASDMTRELFSEYMDAGRLLVVEGGAADWRALQEWDLDWFISHFPLDAIQLRSARSGVEYDARPSLTLGEYRAWVADKVDERHYFSWVNNEKQVSIDHLQGYYSVPPYFPRSATAAWKPEWIYFGTKGSGVDRHMDKMCSAKWSVHLRGEKEWILSSGLARRSQRYRTVLHPGDILLFYPQYWHETTTLSNVSLSFNSYFGWDNTDNEFLRSVVAAAEDNPRIREFYGSCYAQADPEFDMAAFKAMCAALDRGGSQTPSSQKLVRACRDPKAMARMMASAAVSGAGKGRPPVWAVRGAGSADRDGPPTRAASTRRVSLDQEL